MVRVITILRSIYMVFKIFLAPCLRDRLHKYEKSQADSQGNTLWARRSALKSQLKAQQRALTALKAKASSEHVTWQTLKRYFWNEEY